MISSQERHQPNNNPGPSDSGPQRDPSSQDLFSFLKSQERSPKPHRPFFSQNGLSQDIIQVTNAEPDICLEVFYALYYTLRPQVEKQSRVSLKEAWITFIGDERLKGSLCPPEKLIGKKKPKDIKESFSESEGEKQLFQDLDHVIDSISNLRQNILDYPDQLHHKEEIIASLDLVEEFYQGYRNQVKTLGQASSSTEEYDALLDLLEPKAVMMSDVFPHHWAYRIPRNTAQRLLSLDENRRPLKNSSNEAANHRVAAEPLVYFKANGLNTAIKPDKEFMLYSFYRHLQIPVPETALLILTDVFQEDPKYFYAVQASEAVSGTSALEACQNEETIFDQEAYAKQVIGALLTNPSKGSLKNFKYSLKSKTLVGIDNALVFQPQLTEKDNNKFVNVKSILYLLPHMDLAIPKPTKTFFTTLDPHLTMLSWLKDLSQKNQEYQSLFTRLPFQQTRCIYQNLLPQSKIPSLAPSLEEKTLFDPAHHKDFICPQVLGSESLLSNVLEKFQIIEKKLLNHNSVSSQVLFEEISPALGKYYRKLRLEFSDPQEALEALRGSEKNGVNYAEISSLLNHEEFDSLLNNKTIPDVNLIPETFWSDYKGRLVSEKSQLDKFIQYQSERKNKSLMNLSQALKELRLLMEEGLTDSQSPRDIVDFWYNISRMTEPEDHLIKGITSLLSRLPNQELQWLFTLEQYFSRTEDLGPPSLTVYGAFMKQRIFSDTESLFDSQGNIKKNNSLTGRSNVTCFPQTAPELYLKQYPELPGYEFASVLFMRLFGVTRLPYQELIIVNSKYPVLLTQAINGNPVFKVWSDPEAFTSLDPFHTYLLIISAMLLNPEDGKEDNFILTPDGRYLIPIDNDHYFLPSTFQKEKSIWSAWTVNTALQTKTLLFCLDEMNKPIPEEVKQHILGINFDLLLQSWLRELVSVDNRYHHLVNEKQREAFLKNGTVLRISFYPQSIQHLYWKANKIQDLLRSASEQTPFSLLKAVEPFTARCYQDSFQHGKTLQSRFKAATKQLYADTKASVGGTRMSIMNTQSLIKIINISEKDLQNDVTFNPVIAGNSKQFSDEKFSLLSNRIFQD